MGRKQKSAVDKAVILLVLLVLASFYLVQNFAPAKGQNTVGLTVRVNYKDGSSKLVSGTDRMLSVVDTEGKSISSIVVSATLYVEFTGNVSEATIQGQLQTRFDGDVKRGTPFSIPQVIVSGQTYDLAVETTLETDINSWATSGTHTLAYTVPSGAVLTLNFADGNVASKTFGEVSASLTLTVQPSSGITVAEITISPSTSGNATPTPASPTPSGAVVANSGSPQDIQAAVNTAAAAGGGTVYVPAGNFTFDFPTPTANSYGVIVYGGVNVVGAGAGNTILCMTRNPTSINPIMFYLDGSNGKPIRISGISFKGYVADTEGWSLEGIEVAAVKDFRIDHCSFTDFSSRGVGVGASSRGVIDHCSFDNPYKESIGGEWGYGVIVWGDGVWRSMDYYLGQYSDGVTYIEDCTFARCRYAVSGNDAGWYVFRHNTVYLCPNYGGWAKAGCDVHEGSTSMPGGRGLEVYSNSFLYVADYGQQAVKMRAGGGVVYNNVVNVDVGVWLIKADWATSETNYVKDLYIWGNSNTGTPVSADSFYIENVHYFLSQKSGYTPYPYPHPLTLR